jgi:hypothetical protein
MNGEEKISSFAEWLRKLQECEEARLFSRQFAAERVHKTCH